MEVVALLFLQPVGRTNEDSSAEVTGSDRLFRQTEAAPWDGFVVPLSVELELQHWTTLYMGRLKLQRSFAAWFLWSRVDRCTSGRPFNQGKSFPWVITFLFMEPILVLLLKKLPTINAAKIACSAGGKAVPQHSFGELEPAERNIILPWTLGKTKTLLPVTEKFIRKSWYEWQRVGWAR